MSKKKLTKFHENLRNFEKKIPKKKIENSPKISSPLKSPKIARKSETF